MRRTLTRKRFNYNMLMIRQSLQALIVRNFLDFDQRTSFKNLFPRVCETDIFSFSREPRISNVRKMNMVPGFIKISSLRRCANTSFSHTMTTTMNEGRVVRAAMYIKDDAHTACRLRLPPSSSLPFLFVPESKRRKNESSPGECEEQ